jgi:hypothetical protein
MVKNIIDLAKELTNHGDLTILVKISLLIKLIQEIFYYLELIKV